MARKKSDMPEPVFEEALNELEAIVRLMEEGNLSLDEALSKFEQGIHLARICSGKLEKAERKIDMLLCSENGELDIRPFNVTEEPNE